MSMFSMIHDKIAEQQQAQAQQAQQAQAMPDLSGALAAGAEALAQANAQPVDVEQALEEISRQRGNPDLNWRRSIVDLLKLLDLDSSLANRAELARELGYSGEMNGSAESNIGLHRRVMEELERNGGHVPDSLKG